MNLTEFVNAFVDDFQDFQIVSARTGNALSSVGYVAENDWLDWELYGKCPVMGIAPERVNGKVSEYYLRIMIDTKRKEEE